MTNHHRAHYVVKHG